MAITLIYTPCKDEKEAKETARKLIEERLIACANIFNAKSLYFWEGKLNDNTEAVLLCKTTTDNAKRASKRIKELHSYECPAIIRINAEANKKFEKWVKKSVKTNWLKKIWKFIVD